MRTFDPKEIPFHETHRLLLGGVAPRPIAFVGSVDKDGRPNLAPFSFFNAFGANPPIVCFSPAFSGKTGAPKDTFLNVVETGECTISVVTYDMVHQTSLASAPFPKGVDEFEKAGFTKYASQKVKAPGVAESPFIMEARLVKHVDFGALPGGANMMICEILLFHISDRVFDEKDAIDPHRMDQVARMGGAWYTRAAHGLFSLAQPSTVTPGFDVLPVEVRESDYLSGHDLARLLAYDFTAIEPQTTGESLENRHLRAKELIEHNDLEAAWKILLG